jgi:hypothetical protein
MRGLSVSSVHLPPVSPLTLSSRSLSPSLSPVFVGLTLSTLYTLVSPLSLSSCPLSLSSLCRFVPSLSLLKPVTLPLPTPSRRWLIALPLRILHARLAYPSSLYCFVLLAFALPLFQNRRASHKIETVMRQTVGKPCDSAQFACSSLRHVVPIAVPGHHTFFPKSLAA